MLTSIVLPSRGRPDVIKGMISSARSMASGDVQIIVALHENDPAKGQYDRSGAEFREMKSAPTSWMWNTLGMSARGDVIMMAADDFGFMTKGWDSLLRAGAPPDNIWVANFAQSQSAASFGNGYAITARTRGLLGYFTAYWFEHWCSDKWMTDVANLAGRLRQMKNIWIQHIKRDDDTRRTMANAGWVHIRDTKIYEASYAWREAEANKLKDAIHAGG